MKLASVLLPSLLLCCGVLHASTISVNLGQSSQPLFEVGLGKDGSGNGFIAITMGACSASGGNTSCVLSGNFTGSTPGYTGGTYSLVTDYAGTGSSPIVGEVANAAGGNQEFFFTSLPSTTIVLDLDETGGAMSSFTIFDGSSFVGGLGLAYGAGAVCTGAVVSCGTGSVSLIDGATISGPITGSASFTAPAVATTPEPEWLAVGGLLPGAALLLRARRRPLE